MRVFDNFEFSNLEINIIYLRDEKHITVPADICDHLRNVAVEQIENLLVVLENYSIQFN